MIIIIIGDNIEMYRYCRLKLERDISDNTECERLLYITNIPFFCFAGFLFLGFEIFLFFFFL